MMRHLSAARGTSRRSTSPQGFTLIEFVVVSAIIAILAAFLLQVVSKSKAKGQQIACLNNVRQLQIGWTLYSDEHNGMLPLNAQEVTSYSPNASTTNSWVV